MAEEYKKIAYYEEVALLSDTPPEDVTTAAAAQGVATDAARRDHKHDIAVKLNELDAPDADVALNSKKITGLATPVAATDGATKGYVDGVATGLDLKESCRVATAEALPACTAAGSGVNKTLTMDADAILTIDGVATALNDRILVKNQVAGEDNGIYKVTTEGEVDVAAVLTRATDFDEDAEVTAGAYTFIEEGNTLADQGWVLTTNDPITVDTTSLVFGQFSSAGGTPAHAASHQNGGADEITVAGLSGELADDQPPKAHKASHQTGGGDELDLTSMKADSIAEKTGDTGVTVDTCLIKDGKVADSNKLEGSDKATVQDHAPKAHLLGVHTEDTLANLNAKVSDATLDKNTDKRDPNAHAADHKNGAGDELLLHELGEPTAKVPFAGKEGGDFCLENLAANPAVPVLGKIYFKTGDSHPWVCTAIA